MAMSGVVRPEHGHAVHLYDTSRAPVDRNPAQPHHPGKCTVTYEARYLKYLLLTVC